MIYNYTKTVTKMSILFYLEIPLVCVKLMYLFFCRLSNIDYSNFWPSVPIC